MLAINRRGEGIALSTATCALGCAVAVAIVCSITTGICEAARLVDRGSWHLQR